MLVNRLLALEWNAQLSFQKKQLSRLKIANSYYLFGHNHSVVIMCPVNSFSARLNANITIFVHVWRYDIGEVQSQLITRTNTQLFLYFWCCCCCCDGCWIARFCGKNCPPFLGPISINKPPNKIFNRFLFTFNIDSRCSISHTSKN